MSKSRTFSTADSAERRPVRADGVWGSVGCEAHACAAAARSFGRSVTWSNGYTVRGGNAQQLISLRHGVIFPWNAHQGYPAPFAVGPSNLPPRPMVSAAQSALTRAPVPTPARYSRYRSTDKMARTPRVARGTNAGTATGMVVEGVSVWRGEGSAVDSVFDERMTFRGCGARRALGNPSKQRAHELARGDEVVHRRDGAPHVRGARGGVQRVAPRRGFPFPLPSAVRRALLRRAACFVAHPEVTVKRAAPIIRAARAVDTYADLVKSSGRQVCKPPDTCN